MITTSLYALFITGDHTRVRDEFQILMKGLNATYDSIDESPLEFLTILRLTNLQYAIDCCTASPQHAVVWRNYAIRCANMVKKHVTLEACHASLEAAERFSRGEIDDETLRQFYESARTAWFIKGSDGVFSPIDTERLLEIEYFSNQAASEVANPNISWAIDEVHKATGYVLEATGMDVSTVNEIQTREFSEVLL
jgi:hypothetical protein